MNAFHRLTTQFSSMEIEEQDLALLLLTSLSRPYDCLVPILLVGKETLKLEEVTIVLLNLLFLAFSFFPPLFFTTILQFKNVCAEQALQVFTNHFNLRIYLVTKECF